MDDLYPLNDINGINIYLIFGQLLDSKPILGYSLAYSAAFGQEVQGAQQSTILLIKYTSKYNQK
ncbi:hypothetical protein Slin_1889 [Spirosoma linguale DSM 74]|uniref:Uncharacterized protein n=1 Tax=Spirosoma linguale (strain ATCC 33905 / DSM 74 / LMG 10896 / Claus 1) TaxID=504472 RepID=D2QBQ5_SPILD|nr:hypothetical protein Slin_1889 [Spirosoma linguale DSM 74]